MEHALKFCWVYPHVAAIGIALILIITNTYNYSRLNIAKRNLIKNHTTNSYLMGQVNLNKITSGCRIIGNSMDLPLSLLSIFVGTDIMRLHLTEADIWMYVLPAMIFLNIKNVFIGIQTIPALVSTERIYRRSHDSKGLSLVSENFFAVERHSSRD